MYRSTPYLGEACATSHLGYFNQVTCCKELSQDRCKAFHSLTRPFKGRIVPPLAVEFHVDRCWCWVPLIISHGPSVPLTGALFTPELKVCSTLPNSPAVESSSLLSRPSDTCKVNFFVKIVFFGVCVCNAIRPVTLLLAVNLLFRQGVLVLTIVHLVFLRRS